ncbi:uncharacterized protein LOC133905139 [Phragmites australis]|uniref:uncharacterized protein LOC133905139 n=1 Tax=Phragmites australis TaxID=29695 RepID=UPI002D78BA24|nr:uncharacterized protein LOC133905139 [Phragmites australis]
MMARVDRLDLVLGYLEEKRRHSNTIVAGRGSASSPSTPTTTLSDSSAASTPRGRSCRPAKEALEEAQAKGSLVDRIAFLEDRVLRMEEDTEITGPDIKMSSGGDQRKEKEHQHQHQHGKSSKKKGLKSLVKSCVRGKLNTKD